MSRMSGAIVIEAKGLFAMQPPRGRGCDVLRDVHLSARAGEWLSIIGPNGAGKSTLLRCLAGLMPTRAGTVEMMGRPLSTWRSAERASQLAWLGQASQGDDSMTVWDTVALGRLPHQDWLGLSRSDSAGQDDRAAIEQALQDTDMQAAAGRTLGRLSGGERQRVHLARALAVGAPILLLDEPVSHLDAPHQRLLARVLKREVARGRCVISVLHELPLALAADRVAVMQRGQVMAQGAVGEPLVHQAIESVFDQAVSVTRVGDSWTALPVL